jgi:asparagine synthase (glutamine-hydrolysing)
MCGIAGWVDFGADLSGEIETVMRMTRTMVHRGPDAEGYWSCEQAVFGHRRLVVVDPLGGGAADDAAEGK